MLFNNFVLGLPSYNIWRRWWDTVGNFPLFPKLDDILSLNFFRLCSHTRVRWRVCESRHGFIVVWFCCEFGPFSETLTAYLKRLVQFFVANDIGKCAQDAYAVVIRAANQKTIAVIVSAVGKTTYSTLRDLYSPTNTKDKTYMWGFMWTAATTF